MFHLRVVHHPRSTLVQVTTSSSRPHAGATGCRRACWTVPRGRHRLVGALGLLRRVVVEVGITRLNLNCHISPHNHVVLFRFPSLGWACRKHSNSEDEEIALLTKRFVGVMPRTRKHDNKSSRRHGLFGSSIDKSHQQKHHHHLHHMHHPDNKHASGGGSSSGSSSNSTSNVSSSDISVVEDRMLKEAIQASLEESGGGGSGAHHSAANDHAPDHESGGQKTTNEQKAKAIQHRHVAS